MLRKEIWWSGQALSAASKTVLSQLFVQLNEGYGLALFPVANKGSYYRDPQA